MKRERACATCAGDDECAAHETWRCATCKRRLPWSNGAADDMPDSCDECWAKANNAAPAAKIARPRKARR